MHYSLEDVSQVYNVRLSSKRAATLPMRSPQAPAGRQEAPQLLQSRQIHDG